MARTNTLVAEDWKKVYQTFKDADFQSYDFETLRKSMIDYLRLYYPEDFNDFIESSEYVALVDLIAYLGQSLAFRTDLNARENFLDTAERRDSILKLARLIDYSPKRAVPASGYLKIDTVSTTETIKDSTGINITNMSIQWNDPTNDNWMEQLTLVLNSALINSQMIGKSGNSQVINGIKTDEYTINLNTTQLPVFKFGATVGGNQLTFEAVSASSAGAANVYEIPPRPTNLFNMLYRNDNNGNSSINTGFFLYFKQGNLQTSEFTLKDSLANRVLHVNSSDINNDDVWIYRLSGDKQTQTAWKKVPAIAGVNITYNKETERNIFQVVTRADDQIDVVFGDGSFSNIPQGDFVAYYRTSENVDYKIISSELQNIHFRINYTSRLGRDEILTLTASLHYTVANARAKEDIESIRTRAPQRYYTQNRMITGEDYNLFPYSNFASILKVKATNRTSSGISRFLDVTDVTGKYSSTSIFADDGILYKNQFVKRFAFTFNSFVDVYKTIYSNLITILQSRELKHFYYDIYKNYKSPEDPLVLYYQITDCAWHISNLLNNGATGYFTNSTQGIWQLGYVTSTKAKYLKVGSIVKFRAPPGFFFDNHNDLVSGTPVYDNERLYLYASIVSVVGDGTNGGAGNFTDGSGPVTINVKIPSGAIVDQIYPVLKNDLTSDEILQLITNYVTEYKNFGLAYNPKLQQWESISAENLDLDSDFSLTNYGDKSSLNLDCSWIIAFKFTGAEYVVYYRGTDFIFESKDQVKFYFDEKIKVFDSKSSRTVYDQVVLLKSNSKPDSTDAMDSSVVWFVHKNIVEADGYELTNKILLTYPDTNSDNIPDNPDIFDIVVSPANVPTKKLVFQQQVIRSDSFIEYSPIDYNSVVVRFTSKAEIEDVVLLYNIGQLFYVLPENKFYVLDNPAGSRIVVEATGYVAFAGRDMLLFQYKHNSPNYRRIDPSPNNIIDIYILTKTYNDSYTAWIQDTTNTVALPAAPTSEDLELEFAELQKYKAVSDATILNSVKFKPLFGDKAHPSLQAFFKIVKNTNVIISDNEVKSRVITAMNTYFSAEFRDFGESFFFSDLSAYLHTAVSPILSSIILVPKAAEGVFGSLYQINTAPDEILVNAATVDDIEIISSITLAQLTQG